MYSKRHRKFLVGIAAVILFAFGRVTSEANAADKVRFGVVEIAGFENSYAFVGLAKGIYQATGIDLEVVGFNSGAASIQGLLSDVVDVTIGAGAEMHLVLKNVPVTAVASFLKAPVQMSMVVPWNSPAKTMDDLKGKKIGVSSSTSMTAWIVREV